MGAPGGPGVATLHRVYHMTDCTDLSRYLWAYIYYKLHLHKVTIQPGRLYNQTLCGQKLKPLVPNIKWSECFRLWMNAACGRNYMDVSLTDHNHDLQLFSVLGTVHMNASSSTFYHIALHFIAVDNLFSPYEMQRWAGPQQIPGSSTAWCLFIKLPSKNCPAASALSFHWNKAPSPHILTAAQLGKTWFKYVAMFTNMKLLLWFPQNIFMFFY